MQLPDTLIRVEYEQSLYHHPPELRRSRHRNFDTAQSAADFIDALAQWPRHHAVLGVYQARTEWEAVDPTTLPEPKEREYDRDT